MSGRPHYGSVGASSSLAEDKPNSTGEKPNGIETGSTRNFGQNQSQVQRPLVVPPQPQELTAEWTVRAQLTFARAGEKARREFSSNDPLNPVRVIYKWSTLDATAVCVDDDDDLADEDVATTSTLQNAPSSSHWSDRSSPQKRGTPSTTPKRYQSFRSTSSSLNASNEPGADADSAFCSGPTASSSSFKQPSRNYVPSGTGMAMTALYGTRCRSTCNIVVSAVADFLPHNATAATGNETSMSNTRATTATDFLPDMEPDPFTHNAPASYTILPQKSLDDNSTAATTTTSQNFRAFGRTLTLRDAFSQTSDNESKAGRKIYEQHEHPQPETHYEKRRSTAEGLVRPDTRSTMRSKNVDVEGKTPMPTTRQAPSAFKSASMSRIPSLLQHHQQQQASSKYESAEQQKKPRTVHIDVYCTGSEDDDHADGEASTSSDDESKERYDIGSNSTRQTVLNNEQMRLRHQRVTGSALPRRLAAHSNPHPQQQQQQQQQMQQQQSLPSKKEMNLGHAITKSSTAEEIIESKHLLFRKHVGDQRTAKLATLRQKYLRQPSDDALSSIYPNSSHSTVRDATCSSIASTVASLQGAHDTVDCSWQETDEANDYQSVAKSDSFDYANSVDRLRISHMEKYWSRDEESTQLQQQQQQQQKPQCNSKSPSQSHHLQTISEGNSQKSPHSISTAKTPPLIERNNTITSELENISESGTFPGRIMQTSPSVIRTPSPSPKTVKPLSPLLQRTSHFPRNRPGFLQFFGPHTAAASSIRKTSTSASPTKLLAAEPAEPPTKTPFHLQRWKSETRESLCSSITTTTLIADEQSLPQSSSTSYTLVPAPAVETASAPAERCSSEAQPKIAYSSTTKPRHTESRGIGSESYHPVSPSVSEASSNVVAGCSREYLEKARKFGKVVSTGRKPGHHVGPTKNPNCSCESCQRWMAERFQLRGRAFSLGELPVLKRPSKQH